MRKKLKFYQNNFLKRDVLSNELIVETGKSLFANQSQFTILDDDFEEFTVRKLDKKTNKAGYGNSKNTSPKKS